MTNLWTCKQWSGPFERECADIRTSATPSSANYGKHMTAEEVIDFFAPHPSTTAAVTEWLVASGISADRFAISTNKQVRSLPQLLMHSADCFASCNEC